MIGSEKCNFQHRFGMSMMIIEERERSEVCYSNILFQCHASAVDHRLEIVLSCQKRKSQSEKKRQYSNNSFRFSS